MGGSFLLGTGTFHLKPVNSHFRLLLFPLLPLLFPLLRLRLVDLLDINHPRQDQPNLLAKVLTLLHPLLHCRLLRVHLFQRQPVEAL